MSKETEWTYSIVVIDLVSDEEDDFTLITVEKPEEAPEMCPYWMPDLQIVEYNK